ncbi:MAG: hypothetical protein IJ424_07310 [Oscillospiraceae bacterium]|nr:hypothetical protein [Oscillospiraceae bacterium]
MTFEQLHKILDNETYKINANILCKIVYELKKDVFDEYYREFDKKDANNYKLAFYDGEFNAFYIVLDLLNHLE